MKRLSILSSALFFVTVLSMTSCKKYTCKCTAHNINSPESGGETEFKVKGTKKNAKNECEDRSTEADQYGNLTTCVIK